jgi:hypothetical protein
MEMSKADRESIILCAIAVLLAVGVLIILGVIPTN